MKDVAALAALVALAVSAGVAIFSMIRYKSTQENVATITGFNEELRAQAKYDRELHAAEIKELRAEQAEQTLGRWQERGGLLARLAHPHVLTAEFADAIVAKIIERLP